MSDCLNEGVDHTSVANSAAESFGYFRCAIFRLDTAQTKHYS
jgi:hypothetical protein